MKDEHMRLFVYMANGMTMEYILNNVSNKLELYKKDITNDEKFQELNGAYMLLHLKRDILKDGIEKAIQSAQETRVTADMLRAIKTKSRFN